MLLPAERSWLEPPMMGLLGSIFIGIGAVALLGYLIGISGTYAWGEFGGMALHTALGFMVLGVGIIALAWVAGTTEEMNSPRGFRCLSGPPASLLRLSSGRRFWRRKNYKLSKSSVLKSSMRATVWRRTSTGDFASSSVARRAAHTRNSIPGSKPVKISLSFSNTSMAFIRWDGSIPPTICSGPYLSRKTHRCRESTIHAKQMLWQRHKRRA